MDANFSKCLRLILREEGGNDDDPRDHGGRTSRGIIQRVWDAWRKDHPGLPADVWQAPQSEVEAIYRAQYWEPYCPKLPGGIDLVFFDFCVNAGRQQAVKTLQRALGVNPDGMMGVVTLNAVAGYPDIPKLVQLFSARRRDFYRALKQFSIYGRGWMARTDRIEKEAIAMAMKSVVVAPTPPVIPGGEIKAPPTEVQKPPVSVETATTGSIISTILTGISDQLSKVGAAIQGIDLAYAKYAFIAITIICAGLAIYAVIKQRRTASVT